MSRPGRTARRTGGMKMRRDFWGVSAFLLAIGLLVGAFAATAAAAATPRTSGSRKQKTSRPDSEKAYSLEDIMREPK